MATSTAFLLGLFDRDGLPAVAAEDLDGPHGEALHRWQGAGVVATEPGVNPAACCPHCGEGVPYPAGDRYLCNACRSAVDPRALLLWPLNLGAFLGRVAGHLGLRGGVRPVDDCLWQLGTGALGRDPAECFYRRPGPLSEAGARRLSAYRSVVVLHGPAGSPTGDQPGRWLPLLELFDSDGALVPSDLTALLRPRGTVRFDAHSGALWAGDAWLGEAPVGSREYHLLACLAEHLDRFVPYADLKREILRRAGGCDEADEATFCHGLKRRIKKRSIAGIDRLLVTTNRGDGYRLRGHLAEP